VKGETEMRDILNAIIDNPKRMAKLRAIPRYHDKADKAKAYAIAECREQKTKLSEDDILEIAITVAEMCR
jgi:hypothetical protein